MKLATFLKVATSDVKVISASDEFKTFVQYYDAKQWRHYFKSKMDVETCEYVENLKFKVGNVKAVDNMIVVWVD